MGRMREEPWSTVCRADDAIFFLDLLFDQAWARKFPCMGSLGHALLFCDDDGCLELGNLKIAKEGKS